GSSGACRSPTGVVPPEGAHRLPAIVACPRISWSPTWRANVASGSGTPSTSAAIGVVAPIFTVPFVRSMPSSPARPRNSVRSGRSRPSLTAGTTSVPPASTVIPLPSPNAVAASSAEVGTRTSVMPARRGPSAAATFELRLAPLAESLHSLAEIVGRAQHAVGEALDLEAGLERRVVHGVQDALRDRERERR